MRPIIKIAIYLMLLLLLTAEDCGGGYTKSEQAEMVEANMFQELESGFISDELDSITLQALEKRAIQKFRELVDYLNIYADSALEVQFREQARQVIAEAFVSEKDLQEFFGKHELIEDLKNSVLLNTGGEVVRLNVESVLFFKGFEKFQNSNYKGKITYQFQDSYISLGVSTRKMTKSFGNEKLEVWELFFEL